MSKLFRAAVLFAAIGAVMYAGGLTTTAPAQVKDKKDPDKKKVDVDEDEVGVVEVYKSKEGWRYRVKNAEGKTIAMPAVGYDTPDDAMKILNQVKNTLAKAKVKVLKDKK
jgi:uncharacterized protein YegP (UPF0339 family)